MGTRVMEAMGSLERARLERARGTQDHARPEDQMRAIDFALRAYFDTHDWLKARDKEFPGMRSP